MLRRAAIWILFVGWPASTVSAQQILPADRPIEEVVDHYIEQALQGAKLRAAAAEDAAVLRRLTLDLAGRVPTLPEMTEYLAAKDADKKVQLVDRLMASPGFVRHQAQEFFTLLKSPEPGRKAPKQNALHEYLLTSFDENRPWDRMFRDLMLPDEKHPKRKGAAEFLKSRVRDLNRLTIDVSVTFFGVNVSCAQCHDHPHVESWTQDHFYGMKAFLARTVDSGGFLGERDFGAVKYIPNKGQEKVAPVMFLTGKTIAAPGVKEPSADERRKDQERLDAAKRSKKIPEPPQFSLRAKLVETALEPGQRDFFARAIVNRIWHRLFGRGLVMPLDQMHAANRPSHPELLSWLARDLIDHGYDLRRLIRGLVLSQAYARSSRWEGEDAPPEKYFAVAQLRPLTPMQLAVSLRLATTDPTSLPRDRAALEQRLQTLEKNGEKFAVHFPQPGDHFQVGVAEAMLFANNESLMRELLDGPGTLVAHMKELATLKQRAEVAVRAVLSRRPRPDEMQTLVDYMSRRPDGDAACRQVVWALLTSAEFRFNH